MLKRLTLIVVGVIVVFSCLLFGRAATAFASIGNATADAVLGQPDFTSSACDNPALATNQQLCQPVSVAVDNMSGMLFVSDGDDNRVLIWPDAQSFLNGAAASVVLGRPDFSIVSKCPQAVTAVTLCDPNSLTVDAQGNLFVADTDGNRVLEYTPPFTDGMNASLVLGQSRFTTDGCDATATALCHPRGVALDASGNLFVANSDNARILKFTAPLTNDEAASLVIGQANFTAHKCNQGGRSPTATTLCSTRGVIFDASSNLYAADTNNNRVLEYNAPLTGSMAASRVLGEPNFTTSVCTTSAAGLCSPHRVLLDGSGQLYVSDSDNNRVLVYATPLTSRTATRVFGQPNFTSNTATTTATGLAAPQGIAFDSHGNLYFTDEDNNRTLRYNVH